MRSRLVSPWRSGLLGLALLSAAGLPAAGATGDAVADRVLGQANLRTAAPYFVDGRVFGASAVVFDRSAVPNRVYVADAELDRVLGWADERGFLRGRPADLVLGQPSLSSGELAAPFANPPCRREPSAVTLCTPRSLAVDRAGNLYVADTGNLRILEFDRPFASDRRADRVFGQPNFTTRQDLAEGGLGFPEITLDGNGNLFALETIGQQRLLMYKSPRQGSTAADLTLAGADVETCAAGTQGDHLCRPLSLVADAAGNLYVLDLDPSRLGPLGFPFARLLVFRQPIASGLASAFEISFDTGLLLPQGGLAVDAAGDVFFSANTCFARFAAPLDAGSAPACAIARQGAIALARLAFDADGSLFAAQFSSPGDLFANMLLKYEPPFAPAEKPQVVSSPRRTPRTVRYPFAIAIDESSTPNHLYAADLYQRVLGWRDAASFASGAPADLVIGGGRGQRPPEGQGGCAGPAADRLCFGPFLFAGGLAVDGAGNLYVAEGFNHRVLEFDRPFEEDAVADRVFGQGGSFTSNGCNQGGRSAASLCKPGSLAVDGRGNLYVADLDNFRVLLFRDPLRDTVADRVFGQPDFATGYSGVLCPEATARNLCLGELNSNHGGVETPAAGLAVDADGNLYVADGGHNRVLVFLDAARSNAARSDAVADRVLGQSGRFTTSDAGTSARRFSFPAGIALGPEGELYVADLFNSRVLEFDRPLASGPLASEAADRVFGQPDFTSRETEAEPSAARLSFPRAVAVDSDGNLFVADTGFSRVVSYDQP